ncbi:Type II secretory pathway, ATPase PulE/Tfp pilus assembly pathway, ATPase PilB [hydrothermal vent metagenome]|uniref:Type II secretory pathway, ATPase PulE/Tfp pilus assembly pathway, ATPase PilB n=1 Tax=hydrothermal vent metagenome TaxID=652676 RepID=A0A3B0ZH52_9ZZZZ
MEQKSILPISPVCEDDPESVVNLGELVIVSLRSGANLNGKLSAFDQPNNFVTVALKGKPAPVKIPISAIQMLHLPAPKPMSQGANTEKFNLVFYDDSIIDGDTVGYRVDDKGVYLYPKYMQNKYQHSFVPLESIKECRIGDELLELQAAEAAASIAKTPLTAEQKKQAEIDEILGLTAITNTVDLLAAINRQKSLPHMRLGEILVGEKLVTPEQIEEALEEQKRKKGVPLGEILIKNKIVSTAEIQQSLAKKLGIPFIHLAEFEIGEKEISMVPYNIVEQHTVIPIHVYKDKLIVALENPMNWEALDELRFTTNKYVEPVMATEEDIRKAIAMYYGSQTKESESLDDIMDDGDMELETLSSDDEDKDADDHLAENAVVKLLNKIIIDAQAFDASDIHIEPSPGKGKVLVRFRRDGTLVKYHEVPTQYKNALISRIKILARLDISEKRRPQDGKIEFKKPNGGRLELRIAILPTVNGQEDVVMRILAGGKPIPLDDLGVSDHNLVMLKKAITKPYGLFLVCGPTGSGKTTSLHSVLGYINTPERKIWTAEDPVEITQKGLRQMQVNAKIDLTFANAMRAFLRADPDVIMVGEMRDKETVSTGVEASLTGHLVFSTLHTNSAPESIVRLLDMGMDPFNFADALLGILAQRLAKRLCKDCKEAYTPSEEEMTRLVQEYCIEQVKCRQDEENVDAIYKKTLAAWVEKYTNDDQKFTLYKTTGCKTCDDSGYRGRIGIHELLIGTDAVKHNIFTRATVSDLVATGLKEGMRTLRQDGIEKVVQGHTDILAIRAVCAK